MDDFKITPGIKTNLSVKILDYENNPVKKGVVVFKINYKSLKDANGKTIYVKLIIQVLQIKYIHLVWYMVEIICISKIQQALNYT